MCLIALIATFSRVNHRITSALRSSRKFSSKTLNSDTGNKIKNGVEVDKNGRHIAYYVLDDDGKEQRIKAFDDKGTLYAWLAYSNKVRIGSTRGYSILGAIMQIMERKLEYERISAEIRMQSKPETI